MSHKWAILFTIFPSHGLASGGKTFFNWQTKMNTSSSTIYSMTKTW